MKSLIKNIIKKYLHESFGSEETITVYHGTKPKNIDKILKDGLTSPTGYYQGWYMLSTDFESALYHAQPDDYNKNVYVIEFQIPVNINDDRWVGYPYIWEGQKTKSGNTWYALMKKIPKRFITKIHPINYDVWVNQKNDKY